jgi:hypothetical protein
MTNISGFTPEALEAVASLLYAEGQVNKLAGECGQKAKREAAKQPRTPAQAQADQARSQALRGATQQSSAVRSEAAKRAAATRARCKGGGATTGPTTGPTTA